MYQDDPLEPEGGFAPSRPTEGQVWPRKSEEQTIGFREFRDLDSASCPDEDITIPACEGETYQLQPIVNSSKFIKIDITKVQNLEDVKLILNALQLSCTEDMIAKYRLEFLMEDPGQLAEEGN